MSSRLTRRKFIELTVACAAASALSPVFHARARYPRHPLPPELGGIGSELSWVRMGRAIHSLAFYEQPSTASARLDTRVRDESFVILGETRAPFSAHNDLWYETPLGYVHSAWVLPLRAYPPQPFIRDVGAWGFWGEVCQPFTEALAEPRVQASRVYRFYGGTVYHVVEAFQDELGTGWYKVFDELPPTGHQWVLARDVRRVPRSEMAPIRPFTGRKRIEVDLENQRLTCLEGTQIVFITPVASGVGVAQLEDGTVVDLGTHAGDQHVLLKQVSRHMSNRPQKPDDPPPPVEIFDLPGIPWNTFFDLSGTAIHGTYWHNDFGIRRSHGCLNVSCEAARWIYRWTHPVGGFEDDFIRSDARVGTPIRIV
jgi:hypothetical protein